MDKFPHPFGGITEAVRYYSMADFIAAVQYLTTGCDAYQRHFHNFAVQCDGSMIIYTTKSGVECLGKEKERG